MYVQSGNGNEDGPLHWSTPQLATLRHAALGLLHSLAPCFPQVNMCQGHVCTKPVTHVLRSCTHRNCSPCIEDKTVAHVWRFCMHRICKPCVILVRCMCVYVATAWFPIRRAILH